MGSSERTSVTLIRAWRGRKAGVVLPYVPTGQANRMVDLGYAKYTDPPKPKPTRKKRPTKKRKGTK